MTSKMPVIRPDWDAQPNVHAFMTMREGGFSRGSYGHLKGENGLNLGTHVGDDLGVVLQNRTQLVENLNLPSTPMWLNQTHSTIVHVQTSHEYDFTAQPPEADAVVVTTRGQVGVVMTADCLPVLFTSADGAIVGAAHAGWRGLVDGVLEATIAKMVEHGAQVSGIRVWMGAAIGAAAFEVGQNVLDEFVTKTALHIGDVHRHFVAHPHHPDKYTANIYGLAIDRMSAVGVTHITGGDHCTVSESSHFYSYRRDGVTGRMASLIWLS